MNQIKIGSFIAECRKKHNLTQAQLAERLNITDRAVSKWENGKSMPDSSIMLKLCKELDISVNELLVGEVISMDNYNEMLENNLLDMVKEKEESDRRLLHLEIVIGICCLIPLFASIILVNIFMHGQVLGGSLIVVACTVPILVATPFAIKIEQKAGYYECGKCGHRYVPSYGSVFAAMHINRTRYMKCPKCNKRSWQKKVIKMKAD